MANGLIKSRNYVGWDIGQGNIGNMTDDTLKAYAKNTTLPWMIEGYTSKAWAIVSCYKTPGGITTITIVGQSGTRVLHTDNINVDNPTWTSHDT